MKRKNRKLIVLISGLIVANIVLIAVICALFYSKQQKAQSLIAKAQSAYKQADYQGALDCLDKLSDAEKKKPENLLLLAKIEAIEYETQKSKINCADIGTDCRKHCINSCYMRTFLQQTAKSSVFDCQSSVRL